MSWSEWASARDWLNTFSGHKFYPFADDPGVIALEDIAVGLANECRYAGQVPFYSVAEHSVRMSRVLRSRAETREVQAVALLHDAAEAYLGDVPRPLKCRPEMAFYRTAESTLLKKILGRFGLPTDVPEGVRRLDEDMIALEARCMYRYSSFVGDTSTIPVGVPELQYASLGWTPDAAYEHFLNTARALGLK